MIRNKNSEISYFFSEAADFLIFRVSLTEKWKVGEEKLQKDGIRIRRKRQNIDFLLKELCEDLFCHIFDAAGNAGAEHRHMFKCAAPDSVFLHLFQHLLRNDHHILELMSCQNNDLFLQYFKEHLRKMVISQLPLFEGRKSEKLPDSFWIAHISSTFVETVRWWVDNGMKESPETITEYFYLAV